MKKDFYILQIEDEEILAKQTEKLIKENCPFITKMITVESGEKGLAEIKKEMPDFIILNQYMSGITGLEMLERCHSLELELPPVIVITGGLKTRMEEDRFYELGVKYISSRSINDIQKRHILYFIEEAYKTSTKISEEDMFRIISKQLDKIIKDVRNIKQPYNVTLLGFVLRYLLINNMEYSVEIKDDIYKYFQKEYDLTENMINEIREKVEEVIEKNYTKENKIRKINYTINKDDIQKEFFHKLKENVLNDIIVESN